MTDWFSSVGLCHVPESTKLDDAIHTLTCWKVMSTEASNALISVRVQ